MLTIKEVADFLKVNERTIYRMAANNEIPAFKVGGSWRFKETEVEAWLQSKSNQTIKTKKKRTK